MTPQERKVMELAIDLATMHHTDEGYAELRSKVRQLAKEALAQPEQASPMSEPNRAIAYAASSKLHELGYRYLDGKWMQPKEPEQEPDDSRDSDAELNCAEEVLDGYAAHLDLEKTYFDCIGDYIKEVCDALKKAQPAQQEPAGWRPATFHRDNVTFNPSLPDEQTVKFWKLQGVEIEYCYTTLPQRKPLTDAQITALLVELCVPKCYEGVTETFTAVVHAIEAAHGIKE